MKLSAIQVKFETSKYQALKRYAAKKEVSLEQELEETLNRLYRKLVPPDVREYIEEGDEIEKTGKPKVKKEEKEARKPLPIGISDYVRAQSEYYYVDKTGMIKEFLDRKPLISLFTRPRRFGKTLKTARRILVTLVMS